MSWDAGPLTDAIKAAGVPVVSVSVNSKIGTVQIEYADAATPEQRNQARTIADTWDWSDEARVVRDAAAHPERTDLRQQAAAALQICDDYLTLADAATAAQVRAQVKFLTQAVKRLIKRLVQLD